MIRRLVPALLASGFLVAAAAAGRGAVEGSELPPGGVAAGGPRNAGSAPDTLPWRRLLGLDRVEPDTSIATHAPLRFRSDFLPPDAPPLPAPPLFARLDGPADGRDAAEADTVRDAEGAAAAAGDFLDEVIDLGVRVTGRTEVGGDWTRFTPCTERVETTCEPSALPVLRPDLRFGVQVGGVVAERVRVEVDWDQTREFSASNTIRMAYRGGPGETLRSVEVGDVAFGLPPSRFVTEAIPAGNFGVQVGADVGPVDLRAVWAQQRGDLSSRVFRLSGTGDRGGFVQEDTLRLEDTDYARGQFFFLFHPSRLRGHPHLDVLSLDPSRAPPDVAPGPEAIQLYRYEVDPSGRHQVEGLIQADAAAGLDGDTVVESGWFRYLRPGHDYNVHSSGLWVALRVPLSREEMLAVTYVTLAGDTVGDYDPERIYIAGGRPRLRLLRASGGEHQPGRPTWDTEMHQVYRVSTSDDVEARSVGLTLSLGERATGRTFRRRPDGDEVTFLALTGMDREAPLDELDAARVWQPGAESVSDEPPVRGTYLVFPTLRPFLEPPPDPASGLDAEEARALLGDAANARIYEADDPLVRENAGLFRLTIPHRVRAQGVVSSFSLGAMGIREGSERIFLGDRLLERERDYRIDYDVGQVTLTDPEALFLTSRDPVVRATWEQRALFQLSPVSILGVNARLAAGEHGRLELLGMWQGEEAVVRRPQLGIEPASVFLAGMNGELTLPLERLDGWLDGLSRIRSERSSSIALRGELAASFPDPNTQGTVFLDDFDATDAVRISMQEREWRLGSAPASDEGAEGLVESGPVPEAAAGLVWQHRWVVRDPAGDSLGVHEGFFPRDEIDQQINVLGSSGREAGLRLSLGRHLPFRFDRRRARSVTTVLAPNGMDLSRTEFLEFYATSSDSAVVVIDLGRVSEDAFFIDSAGRTSGSKSGGEPWGLGRLDQEADPRRGEVWSDEADRRGVWGEACVGGRAQVFAVGDPRANCTRGNGRADSEDLDGDGVLDVTERHLRWTVSLDGDSPYLVRDRTQTGTGFRLYRIPVRGPDAVRVGGDFTEADRRSVRHLRLTLTSTEHESVTLTRMTLSGSRWVKRTLDGVARGLVGDTAGSGGPVEVGSVSRLTEGAAYRPPPGVLEELDDPSTAVGGQGVEFAERSLGVRYRDLPPGQRVEVYNRFPQTPRDFLTYREIRLWVLARRGDWGADRPVHFFVKVGSDEENFYLFRTRLEPAADPGAVLQDEWRPELVVDVERWLELRRRAEEELVRRSPSPGDPPLEVWSADSTYAVILRDRARAPNLAAVREIAMGVWNRDAAPVEGEVWIDELRLGGALRDPGLAGHVDVDLAAGDVLLARLSHTRRGGSFRQLETGPTFRTDSRTSGRGTFFLDRLAPEGWRLEMPVTVHHERTAEEPDLLSGSDLRAHGLQGLRATGSSRTRVDLALRRRPAQGGAEGWAGVLLDGLELRAGWFRSRAESVVLDSRADGVDARLGWYHRPAARTVPFVPSFLGGVLRTLLPRSWAEGVLEADVRWSPARIGLSTGYVEQENRFRRFDEVLHLPGDTLRPFVRAPNEDLETEARVTFEPLSSLTADLTLLSYRDLLHSDQVVDDPELRPLFEAERRRFAGIDLGWETNRNLRTDVSFRPRPFPWLETDLHWGTAFATDRDATFAGERVVPGDTLRILERNVSGRRDLRASLSLSPGALRSWAGRIRPVRLGWREGVSARFDRDPVRPGTGYQLGWVGASSLRVLGSDTAATLTDRTSLSAGSGLDLPLGIALDVAYVRGNSSTLDTRSDRTRTDRTWPDARLTLGGIPVPDALTPVLEGVRLSTGYRRTVEGLGFGGPGAQSRGRDDRRIPLDVSLSWAGGIRTRYRGELLAGEGTDPTGETERRHGSHLLSVTSELDLVGITRLEEPLHLSLSARWDEEDECRRTAGAGGCVPYIDRVSRALEARLDTRVSRVDVGLQAAWTERKSYIGIRPGSTRFQLDLFGRFRIDAGDPALLPVRTSIPEAGM